VLLLSRVLIAIALLSGCASVKSPTPSGSWLPGTRWNIRIDDRPNGALQDLTLQVTSDKADSCLGGDWRRLKRVAGSYKGLSEPAYSVEGDRVTILLVSDVCDGYDQLDGELKDGRYSARHSLFGWGSKDIGVADGTQTR